MDEDLPPSFLQMIQRKEGLTDEQMQAEIANGNLHKMFEFVMAMAAGGIETQVAKARLMGWGDGRALGLLQAVAKEIRAMGDGPHQAVDLASGTACIPLYLQMALGNKFQFTPTDFERHGAPGFAFDLTKAGLRYQLELAAGNLLPLGEYSAWDGWLTERSGGGPAPLIRRGDEVQLHSLGAAQYNGRRGFVQLPESLEPAQHACEGSREQQGPLQQALERVEQGMQEGSLSSEGAREMRESEAADPYSAWFHKRGHKTEGTHPRLPVTLEERGADGEKTQVTKSFKVANLKLLARAFDSAAGEYGEETRTDAAGTLSLAIHEYLAARSMLSRAAPLDLTKEETWSSVSGLLGQCALVTCTTLLISVGLGNPLLWQPVAQLASRLLRPGGLLLTYDTEKWGGYGNREVMEAFFAEQRLGLTFVKKEEPADYSDDPDGRMFTLVWQRE